MIALSRLNCSNMDSKRKVREAFRSWYRWWMLDIYIGNHPLMYSHTCRFDTGSMYNQVPSFHSVNLDKQMDRRARIIDVRRKDLLTSEIHWTKTLPVWIRSCGHARSTVETGRCPAWIVSFTVGAIETRITVTYVRPIRVHASSSIGTNTWNSRAFVDIGASRRKRNEWRCSSPTLWIYIHAEDRLKSCWASAYVRSDSSGDASTDLTWIGLTDIDLAGWSIVARWALTWTTGSRGNDRCSYHAWIVWTRVNLSFTEGSTVTR